MTAIIANAILLAYKTPVVVEFSLKFIYSLVERVCQAARAAIVLKAPGKPVQSHGKPQEKTIPRSSLPNTRLSATSTRAIGIFIGTGCGEPQYLVAALIKYVESHPKAFFDAEVIHVWTLGLAPYTDKKFKQNFRHNSFFIGDHTRESVNQGLADYTPIFLSQVPDLFNRKVVPVDVALIQTSLPDQHGYMSLGVSVDITKAAVANARIVIVQANAEMPRTHGDTFLHADDVDFIIRQDAPLLEYQPKISDDIAQRIGRHVARFIEDGDTLQVGYGSIPNAILANLKRQEAPGRAYGTPDGRHRGTDEGRRDRQHPEKPEPGKGRGQFLHGAQGNLRVHP